MSRSIHHRPLESMTMRFLAGLALASSLSGLPAAAAEPGAMAPRHSLFVWAHG